MQLLHTAYKKFAVPLIRLLMASVIVYMSKMTEVYLEPSRTSTMELFREKS